MSVIVNVPDWGNQGVAHLTAPDPSEASLIVVWKFDEKGNLRVYVTDQQPKLGVLKILKTEPNQTPTSNPMSAAADETESEPPNQDSTCEGPSDTSAAATTAATTIAATTTTTSADAPTPAATATAAAAPPTGVTVGNYTYREALIIQSKALKWASEALKLQSDAVARQLKELNAKKLDDQQWDKIQGPVE